MINYEDIKDEDLERFKQNDLEMLARRSIATLLKKTHSIRVINNNSTLPQSGKFTIPLSKYVESEKKEEEL